MVCDRIERQALQVRKRRIVKVNLRITVARPGERGIKFQRIERVGGAKFGGVALAVCDGRVDPEQHTDFRCWEIYRSLKASGGDGRRGQKESAFITRIAENL